MSEASGVYVIVNSINGKRYIGSANNFDGRFRAHRSLLRKGKHHSVHLQRSYDKHGKDAFRFMPLLRCEPEECVALEQLLMDGMKPEFNMSPTAGSQLGLRFSEESRERISKRLMGNQFTLGFQHSEKTRRRMSERKKGNSITLGRKLSPEHRKKISRHLMGNQHTRGHKYSEERKEKMSNALRELWKDPEYRKRQTERMIGTSYAKGYRWSDEAKERMSHQRRGHTYHTKESKRAISEAKKEYWRRWRKEHGRDI